MNWQNKNILITGISGFIGPYLAEELIRRGANVFLRCHYLIVKVLIVLYKVACL